MYLLVMMYFPYVRICKNIINVVLYMYKSRM